MDKGKGVLVVITSIEACGICTHLHANGTLKRIEDKLDVEEVYTLDLDDMGPALDQAAIFNLDTHFPRFIFMSSETFDLATESGDDWQSIYPYVRFYNRIMDPRKGLVPSNQYPGEVTFDTMQRFCKGARKSLRQQAVYDSRHITVPPPVTSSPVTSRYGGGRRRRE